MAIKILVISDYRETVTVRSEAEIFIALQKSGYEVSIMTYPESQYIQRFREAGIKVIEYHPTKKLSRKDVSIIKDEIVNGNYDILHLFNSPSMPNGIMAAYGTKVKVILYRGYTGNIHWYDPFMYIKYLSPRVDKIVCLVEAIRQLFLKNFVSERKLITINKGHDLAWYEGIEPDALAELHIPPDALKLVCAANMRPMKGVKYLLKATHYLPADANIHLLLLGRDMDAPEFKKLIDESPIKNNIHQLGYRKDVLNVVKACDVFVLASIKGEAITKAVIEAMSLGVAPLITDIPGNVDLVINEKCGLVVPSKNPQALAEAILKYDQQRQLVKIYGEAAKEHIKNRLNIKDTIAQFQQMYDELLNA
ncbi:MAG TPA: glycosyltransferase family 4 protein [Cyclobacteriaceae bacterium]|nr:glycosyltransferase family 4 protein [Cyclobacteriaceae bacterium]